MTAIFIVCFLLILALLLFSIGFGLRFNESRRRGKLISMLRTVTEDGEERHVNLLIDPDAKERKEQTGLGSKGFNEKIARLLADAGLDWTVQRFVMTTVMAFVAGFVIMFLVPSSEDRLIRALAVGMIASGIPLFSVKRKRDKRLSELEAQLPDALDFLSRSMRAGHAFSISLEMVGEEIADPLGQEFRALFNELNLGASLDRGLESFSVRVPLPDVRFFSSAVLLQRQTGGNLAEILTRLSHIIRERFRLKGQVKAVSAHGRMTATILTLLPLATLGGLMATSPGYLEPMFHDELGKKIIAAGVVAQIIGNYFIRKIIKIKV
jgi:tight adherence protein B